LTVVRGKGHAFRRDWRQAIAAHEGEGCRVCGNPNRDLAHVLPRTFDRRRGEKRVVVHPLAVVPLCSRNKGGAGCHEDYDAHRLNLLPYLTEAEVAHAVNRVGRGLALRHIAGRDPVRLPATRNRSTLEGL
jgi:hypothetical protein